MLSAYLSFIHRSYSKMIQYPFLPATFIGIGAYMGFSISSASIQNGRSWNYEIGHKETREQTVDFNTYIRDSTATGALLGITWPLLPVPIVAYASKCTFVALRDNSLLLWDPKLYGIVD
jgi:hypothetical protein